MALIFVTPFGFSTMSTASNGMIPRIATRKTAIIPLAWFEKSSSSCTQSAVKEPALFPPERPRPEKGESTMIVTYNLKPNTPLTPEQIKRLDALKDRPIVFDEDCPEMTDEQLRQFKRVHPHREDTAPDRKLG